MDHYDASDDDGYRLLGGTLVTHDEYLAEIAPDWCYEWQYEEDDQ
jgi:hypothetical protein